MSTSRSQVVEASSDNAGDQSATGHMAWIGRQGADNWYSFSAIKHTDPQSGEDVVKGEVEYHSLQLDGNFIDVHGTVICLGITANVARVGIVGDFSRNLPNPGPGWAYFTVVDNGEGAGAADMGSNLFASDEATARAHCETGHVPPPLLFVTLRGNIQVRN